MSKFFKLISISMQSHLYYRTSFFINLLTPIVTLAGQYILWITLYGQQGGIIGGMTKEAMLSYILVAFAMNNLLSWSTENTLSKEIRSGTVIVRCIRPVSFLVQYVSEMLGSIFLQGIINIFIVIGGFWVFGKYMRLPMGKDIILFIPCLFAAILLRIMLIDIFSLFCFFSTGHLGISWTRIALFDFFSGALIPVTMFPEWLKTVSYITPFPYMIQIPIAVLLGEELTVKLPVVFSIQLLWLSIFGLLHAFIYYCVRKNMSIAGG